MFLNKQKHEECIQHRLSSSSVSWHCTWMQTIITRGTWMMATVTFYQWTGLSSMHGCNMPVVGFISSCYLQWEARIQFLSMCMVSSISWLRRPWRWDPGPYPIAPAFITIYEYSNIFSQCLTHDRETNFQPIQNYSNLDLFQGSLPHCGMQIGTYRKSKQSIKFPWDSQSQLSEHSPEIYTSLNGGVEALLLLKIAQ